MGREENIWLLSVAILGTKIIPFYFWCLLNTVLYNSPLWKIFSYPNILLSEFGYISV